MDCSDRDRCNMLGRDTVYCQSCSCDTAIELTVSGSEMEELVVIRVRGSHWKRVAT